MTISLRSDCLTCVRLTFAGSDIVVERMYEHWTDRIMSKRMFERVE